MTQDNTELLPVAQEDATNRLADAMASAIKRLETIRETHSELCVDDDLQSCRDALALFQRIPSMSERQAAFNTRPTQGHDALVEAWNKRVGTIEVTSGAELPHLKIVFDDKDAMRAFNDTLTNLPTPQAEGEDRRRLLEDLDYRISTAYAFVAEVEQETRTPKEQAWGNRWAATLRSLANALQTARDALKATPQAEAISLPPELKGVDLLNDPLTPEQQEALASVSEAEEAPSDGLVVELEALGTYTEILNVDDGTEGPSHVRMSTQLRDRILTALRSRPSGDGEGE